MNNLTVARRYAGALYEEAVQRKQVEAVDADVDLIRQALDDSRELVTFFESPVISRDKKEAVVQQLFQERVQPTTFDFLRLLIDKGREDIFPAVVAAYRTLRDEQQGVVEAKARTALPLGEAEQKELAAALERMSGKQVRLSVTHDPGLIGGVIVRVGDTVYDGSVRHQLASLREQLSHGRAALN